MFFMRIKKRVEEIERSLTEMQTQLSEIAERQQEKPQKATRETPMNLTQAAKFLQVSKAHLYRLTANHKIPFSKPNGKRIYFSKSDLWNFIRNKKND